MSFDTLGFACETWKILSNIANKKTTITYGELANELGIHHRPIRLILGLIQDYCIEEDFPPLTILVVKASGLPGSGFIAHNLNKFNEGLSKVYDSDFLQKDNPFCIDDSNETELIEQLIKEPDNAEDIYRKVKSRGMQQVLFRKALLKAYKGKCAITGIKIDDTLEACHIIPWAYATDSQKLDIRNGILLNRFHHKLFDIGLIKIDSNYRIRWDGEDQAKVSEFEKMFTIDIDGMKLNLPKNKELYPLYEYIQKHNDLIQ